MCIHNAITMLHQLFHQLLRVFLWTLVPVFWCVRYMFVCVCVYVWCKYCKYYTICVGKSMIWSCLESGTTCLTAVFAILYLSTYVLICWFIFICWPSYERFLVNIDRPGWQKADWKKSELFPCSFCQEQSVLQAGKQRFAFGSILVWIFSDSVFLHKAKMIHTQCSGHG